MEVQWCPELTAQVIALAHRRAPDWRGAASILECIPHAALNRHVEALHGEWAMRASRLEQQSRAAGEAEKEVRKLSPEIAAELAAAGAAAEIGKVEAAVKAGKVEAAAEAAVPGDVLPRSAPKIMRRGIVIGRKGAATVIRGDLGRQARGLLVADVPERAAAWAQRAAGQLIRDVTEETRAAVREAVAVGLEAREHPRVVARRLEQIVGVNARQGKSLARGAQAMVAQGSAESAVLRALERRAAAFRRQRSQVIARTETFRAMSQGRTEMWHELGERDLVQVEQVERTWVAAMDERTEEICAGLDGETVGLDEEFPGGYDGPPAHPSCRCTLVIEERRR